MQDGAEAEAGALWSALAGGAGLSFAFGLSAEGFGVQSANLDGQEVHGVLRGRGLWVARWCAFLVALWCALVGARRMLRVAHRGMSRVA
ncbi:hypothetical protein SU48_07275 [Deinococcus puniceus]|uniref:Uncharacterized protein n=1 Tax=Deinococcus puniceus TaxID=1182568 RepID=A0A172T9B3_9DEIO|nr:hypothetical protein SU48_07275 [Deinococcus puniceus]